MSCFRSFHATFINCGETFHEVMSAYYNSNKPIFGVICRVATDSGKQGKWSEKIPCREKIREFEKMIKIREFDFF